jgi:hypothetical protein
MKRILSSLSVATIVLAMTAFGYAQTPTAKCCQEKAACCEKAECCQQDSACCHKLSACCHKATTAICCDGADAAKAPKK